MYAGAMGVCVCLGTAAVEGQAPMDHDHDVMVGLCFIAHVGHYVHFEFKI